MSVLKAAAGALVTGLIIALVNQPVVAKDNYPARPITVIVAYPAGGSMDSSAQVLTRALTAELGQKVIIQHVGGANGMIGARRLAQAAPDGYTLLFGTNSEAVIAPSRDPNAGYRATDLVPIAPVSSTAMVLVARHAFGALDVAGVVAMGQRPEQPLKIGITGVGTLQDILAQRFASVAALHWLDVPYPGAAPMMQDLIGGRLDLAVVALPTAMAYLPRKQVKAIALFSAARSPLAKHIPSINEHAPHHPYPVLEAWTGLFAPQGVPARVTVRLQAAMMRVLANPAVQSQQRALGTHTPRAGHVASFPDFVAGQIKEWQVAPAVR